MICALVLMCCLPYRFMWNVKADVQYGDEIKIGEKDIFSTERVILVEDDINKMQFIQTNSGLLITYDELKNLNSVTLGLAEKIPKNIDSSIANITMICNGIEYLAFKMPIDVAKKDEEEAKHKLRTALYRLYKKIE